MIYITAPLVGDYMKKKLPSNKSVYLVGSPAVSSELVKNGIKNFGHGVSIIISYLFCNHSVQYFIESVFIFKNISLLSQIKNNNICRNFFNFLYHSY